MKNCSNDQHNLEQSEEIKNHFIGLCKSGLMVTLITSFMVSEFLNGMILLSALPSLQLFWSSTLSVSMTPSTMLLSVAAWTVVMSNSDTSKLKWTTLNKVDMQCPMLVPPFITLESKTRIILCKRLCIIYLHTRSECVFIDPHQKQSQSFKV